MTRIILLIALAELVPVVLIVLIFKVVARRKERRSSLIDADSSPERGSPPEH